MQLARHSLHVSIVCYSHRTQPLKSLSHNRTMVPPPKRVDAVEIHNTTEKPVQVTVAYDNHKEQMEETVTEEVPAGGKHTFAKRELDMGSWTAVAPVKHIEAGGHRLQPDVHGVVPQLSVSVVTAGSSLKLQQH